MLQLGWLLVDFAEVRAGETFSRPSWLEVVMLGVQRGVLAPRQREVPR